MAYNVLVVDDSSAYRSMVQRTLELSELSIDGVHHAADGREALDILEAHWVDLVFADVNMPVMNGVELVDRMAEDPNLCDVPVVIITSEGATRRIDKLRQRGVAGYLRKPCSPESIRDVVERVTGLRPPAEPKEQVVDLLRDVLRTLAYVVCEELDDSSSATEELLVSGDDSFYWGRVEFRGAKDGGVELLVPERLADEISANFLGTELGPGSSVTADAMGEVVNVTCGHLMSSLTSRGDDSETTVSSSAMLPFVDTIDADGARKRYRTGGWTLLTADRECLAVKLEIEA